MKLKTALLGVLAAMLVFAVLQARGGLLGVAKEDVRSAAFLGKVAAEFNKQLPKQVDAETELANVTGLEGVLVYNYRLVNQLASEVSRIKRLQGLDQPQYRLRVGEIRVFYDVTDKEVQVLAIVSKAEAQAWLDSQGTPTPPGGPSEGEG